MSTPVSLEQRPVTWSHDQDVFRLDPGIYGGCEALLAGAADGALDGVTFTSSSADFTSAAIRPGDVIEFASAGSAPWQRGTLLLRVIEVTGPTSLQIARLELHSAHSAAFAVESGRPWQIRTMDHWRRLAWRDIAVQRLRLDDPHRPLTPGDTSDDADNIWRSEDLAECEALLALAKCHASRWNGSVGHAAQAKSADFMRRFEEQFTRIQVLLRSATTGSTPSVRLTPGATQLRRG
ncbi:MAG: hypothetical protein ACOC0P_01295 [Planctomycetota bacterium]